MWKVRTKVLPVIIGALETIKKGLDQKLELLLVHPLSIDLQTTLMSTAQIIRKSAEVNCFGLFLRSGLTRRPPLNN